MVDRIDRVDRVDGQKTKNKLLTISKRLVPGTIDISHCHDLGDCVNNKMRSCNDIKNLCISCRDNERVIGGISFTFGIGDIKDGENGIVIYRYGQEGDCAKMIEGNGIEDIMGKLEKDEEITDITERTKFIKKERKEADDLEIIEAFKRYVDQSDADFCILVTKKNSGGEYEDLDKELIKIAKEKEEKTGKRIKIVDGSEIDRKVYVLGIYSKEIMEKLILEAKTINDVESRVHIFVIPVAKIPGSKTSKHNLPDYVGILAINSIDDDVVGVDDKKDEWKKYFTEKYKELQFISTEMMTNIK
jgi:hypothetical protein